MTRNHIISYSIRPLDKLLLELIYLHSGLEIGLSIWQINEAKAISRAQSLDSKLQIALIYSSLMTNSRNFHLPHPLMNPLILEKVSLGGILLHNPDPYWQAHLHRAHLPIMHDTPVS